MSTLTPCLDSADRRLVHFTVPGILNTTTLLLSDDASTLYVGARNAILSLNVSQHDVISLKNKVGQSLYEGIFQYFIVNITNLLDKINAEELHELLFCLPGGVESITGRNQGLSG